MAIWQIRDVSRVSARHGLQFKQLEYNPESMIGFVILNNSSDDLLNIRVFLRNRRISPANIKQLHEAGKLDLTQASYLKGEAGIDLGKAVYSFD